MAPIRARLGVAIVAGALFLPSAAVRADVIVNGRAGDSCGPPNFSCSQVDPSIARQGSNLVVGFYADSSGPNHSGYAWSNDLGVTWTDGGVLPRGSYAGSLNGRPSVVACGGSFFYASEALSDQAEITVSRGTFSGSLLGWGTPAVVASGAAVGTPSLACDPASGNLYLAFAGKAPSGSARISLARSLDGGATWDPPVTVRQAGTSSLVSFPSATVGIDGKVHVAWTVDRSAVNGALFFEVGTSVDAGETFGSVVRAANFSRGGPSGAAGTPADRAVLTADRGESVNAGNLYLAFHSLETRSTRVRDVFVARSVNRGASFEPAVVVNHDPLGNDQFLPTVTTNRATGQVGVLFYSSQLGPLGTTDAFVGLSIDGGSSFVPAVRIGSKSTYWPGVTSDVAPPFGSSIGLIADARSFLATWTDGRFCTPDIFFSSILRKEIPSCASLAEGAACDDGNPCTTGETCRSGVCAPAGVAACNVAATDCRLPTTTCDARAGCVGLPKPDGTTCGAACSVRSSCTEGVCIDDPQGGGDPDGDRICSLDDNCPGTANPTQADIDGDGAGDACDPSDVGLRVGTLSVRRSTGSANGAITLRSEFIYKRRIDSIDLANGIALRVKDSATLDTTISWPRGSCRRLSNGATRCRMPKAPYSTIEFRPLPSGNLFEQTVVVTARVRGQQLRAPFAGPMSVWVANAPGVIVNGIDRAGATEDCRSYARGTDCRGAGGTLFDTPVVVPTPTPTPAPPPPCVEGYGSPSRAFLGGPSASLVD